MVAALTLRLSSGAATLTDPCASPGWNAITCENSKPGAPSTAWSTGGAGDATLQGFATEISVNHGQTANFKITDTNGSTGVGGAYHIDIYRLGYYQGNGARLQATIASTATTRTAQAACLKETATGLTDCGNWTVSASWAVPATAVSGLYFANLVRDTTGANSHIYFVVRDDERHAPILFQTSDETWQAYNAYGGNSLYGGTAPTSNGRAYKASYNRPLTTGNNSARNEPMYAEYPTIRFLEKNGYDVSYFTNVDAARSGAEILNHKAFMSVGHDEYWSGEQRANVTAARDAGVNLAFLSGNEIFWKTRFTSSISTGAQAWRTVVCYKESKENTVPIDPANPPTSTGTWRDPRFGSPSDGAKPENALTGQFFMVDAIRDDAIAIPYAYSQLRFWRNTSIAQLTAGQTATLPVGTLGYEWDSDVDNGSRPRGLIRMSSTTVPVTTLLTDSTGQAEGSGNATHNLTLYRAPSGALVFGAGTVQWSFGLDDQHTQVQDTSNPAPNLDMQQATVNLLADMGTQPATLATGLVTATQSTDTAPPTSTISYPTSTTLLTPTQSVTATGTAADPGGVVGGVEVSVDGGTTWHPATGTSNWSYTFVPGAFGQITIQTRATDDSANVQTTPTSATIPVGSCPCNIFGQVTPTNTSVADPNPYELGVKFRSDVAGFITGIRFYKGAGNTGSHIGHLWTGSGTLIATASFTGETATGWQQVTFGAPVPINPNTTYVASYFTSSGNYAADRPFFAAHSVDVPPLHALADGTDGPNGVYASGGGFPTSSFQASNYYVDVIFNNSNPPTVDTVTPAANAIGVAASAGVTAAFSQPMSPTTIDNTTITVRDAANALVPATVTYDTATSTATLTPNQPLALSTTYTATVTGGASGVKNTSGTPLAADVTWTFTTATPADCPCTIFPASATPTTVSSFDTTANELGVKFRSDESGYIRGIRFYKGSGNTGTHVGHLWSSTGAMLAEISFANETAGGWQQVNFPRPVAIAANTTYIASYYAPNGGYALDRPYFSTGVDRSPLHALADGASGPNGVFAAGGGFPTQGANMSNYWVDAVFDTNGSDLTPPVIGSVSPAAGTTGIARSRTVTVAFDEPVDPLSVTTTNVALRNPSNVVVPATVSYDSTKASATVTPSSPLALSTTYTVVVKGGSGGIRDTSGNLLAADYTSTFVTGTPATCPCNLLGSATPTLASTTDTSPTEVGVKFRSDLDGYVTGLRFYKGAQNTGTHVGHLWSSSGALMGSAQFETETSTGWQQVSFSPAIAVSANTTYVASYFAPNGGYALDRPYFSSWLDRSPLHALAEGVEGSNGVYAAGQAFPNQAFDSSASNYWVDPVFNTAATGTAPTVTSTSPAPNATGVSRNTIVTAVFSELLDPATVSPSSFQLRDASGASVPSTVTYDAATTTATLTPTAPLTPGAAYTATVSGGAGGPRNTGGAALESDVSWSFTISADAIAPVTTIACNAGGCANWFGTSPVNVALSASDNAGGSGVGTTTYTIDGSDPTTSASAAVYTAPFTVTTTTTVRYSSTDRAGNIEAPGSAQVRIDTTPPSAPSLSFGAFSNASGSGSTVYFNPTLTGGFTVTASATDAESGVAAVNYPTFGSGWTRTGSAYSFATGAADPVEPNNVTVTNNAGLTSGATSFNVTADGTAPATSASCNGVVCPAWSTSSPVSIALNATDSGSGVAATYYTTDGSDPSVVHGTLYLGAFPVAVTTTIKFRSYDNVGNAGAIGSQLVQVDTTPPSTPALTLTETSPFEHVSGSTLYYGPTGTNSGTFTVGATTADAESGISKVTFPGVTGLGAGGDVLSAPYQSSYTWSAPTATSGSQTVTARNAAGLAASSAFTLTPDTTAPSGGSITYTDGYTAAGTISITTTNGSDAGAGVNASSGVLQRDSSPLTNGTCGAFPGTWTTAVSPDTTLVSATCYRYRYLISDNVGNTAVYTSPSVVKVDSTAPSTPALTLSSASATQFIAGTTIYYGNSSAGSFTVTATSADAESGIKQVTFPALTGMTGGGADTSSPYQGVYNWTTSSTTSGPQNVTATNNASVTSANAPFTVTLDATVPTLSIASPTAGAKLRNGAALTPSVSDAGSGMKQVEFRYCAGTSNCNFNSGLAIGTATSAPFTVTWNSQPADGSYTIVARATDNVGNVTVTAPSAGTQVVVDNTVPTTALSLVGTTASYLSAGTLYFANTAGAFSLHIDVLDPQPASGVKNVLFPAIATTGWTGASSIDTTVPYENAYTFPAAAATPAAKTITTSDNAGNLQNDTVTFVKDQTAPSVSLTAPATATKLKNGATVSATASDAGAGIRQVEFRYCPGTTCAFASGTTIGTATSAPYTVAWNSQPADGTYTIAVQATDNVGNTATDGTATVTLDNTAPATTLSVVSGTRPDLQYFAAGTLYYNPAATGDFAVSETATDPSGVASVAFPAITQTGFNGTAKTSTSTPYVSNTYTFGATNVAAPPPAAVVATDIVGNIRSDSLLFVLDNTAPTGGSISYTDGYAAGGTVGITTNAGTDPGAGIAPATAVIERQVATLTGDICGSFGTWTAVTSPDTLASGTCARYRLRVSDRVGNEALYTSTNVAKSDTSAAAAPTLTFGSFTGASATGSSVYYNPAGTGGFTVIASSSDADSGIASYGYPSLGGGWSTTGNGAYSFAAGATDPTEPNNVTAVNGAGLTSAPTSFTVSADATAPASTVSCNGGSCGSWFTTSPVSVTLNATDGGSGVDRILYSTDGSAPSSVYSGPISVTATTTVKVAAVDKVGNTESTRTQVVQVDTTAPAAPSLSLGAVSGAATVAGGTLYFNPASTGGFTVTPSATDAESGIDHYSYPGLGTGWSATGGAYTFAAGASDPTEPNNVTATNSAGFTSPPTSFTVTADTTAPTTTISCDGGSCAGTKTTSPVSITLNATDAGSGVNRILYSTDGSAPSLVYSGPISLSATATVKFAATDKVGNTETVKSQLIQIDTSAPTAPTLSFSAFSNASATGSTVYFNPASSGGFTITASSTDSESTIDHYNYPSLGSGWAATVPGAYTFAAGATDPTEPNNVTATNSVGLTSPPTSFTVTADGTAPATSAACNGGSCANWLTSSPVTFSLSASDVGSGVDRILYSTDGSAPNLLYSAALTLNSTTTVKFAAYDRVGNLEATKSQLVRIDVTAPTAPALTLAPATGTAVTGTNVFYNPATPGGFTVSASSTDPESGIASYAYPSLGLGWTNTGGAYSYGSGVFQPGPASVTATNNAGLTSAPSSFTVTADTTAPTTAIACTNGCTGWHTTSPVSVTLSASDTGSGLDRILYSTDGSVPSLLYGAPLTLTATTNLKFAAYDRVGNLEATKTQLVQIDISAPTAPALSFSALTNASATGSTLYYNPAGTGGFTVTASSTDAESGIDHYTYPSLGSGWTNSSGAYSFAASATDPAEPNNVTATNGAGLSSAATSFTVTADATAPAATISCDGGSCAGWHTTSPVSVTLNATDVGSGVNRILYSTDGSTPSTVYSGPVSISATATVKFVATDKVGNSTATTSTLVQVDATAPTTPALAFSALTNASVSGSTVYYRPGKSGGFTVTGSSSDSESGVASYAYPVLGSGWSNTDGAYTFVTNATQPLGASNVTATNNAGLVSAPASFTVLRDANPPTTSIHCKGGPCPTGFTASSVPITLDATDGSGSGVTSTMYTLDGSDPSPLHGNAYLGGFSLTSSTTVKFRSYDAVGNEEAVGTQVVNIDTTAPAAPLLSISAPSPAEFASGTTLYYNPSGTNSGSFTVTATASDPESGISKVTFPAILGMTGGGDTTTTFSSTYAWSASTTASGNQTVTARNGSDLTSTAPFTVVSDTTAPSGGSVAYPDGFQSSGVVTIATTDGTDGGSGIDPTSRTLERQTAPLTNGSCQTFGAWTAATSPDSVPDATCARYRYRLSDRVGNQQIYTSANVVKVDAGAPATPTLTLSGASPNEYLTGTTLYYNPSGTNSGSFTVTAATSAASGVDRVTFPALTGIAGGGDDTAAPYSTTYNWTQASTASGAQTVTAKSSAGGSSTATFTVTPDTDAPTGQTAALVGGPWFTTTSISIVTTNGSDAISGLATGTALLERASATLTGGTCGTFGTYGGSYTSPDTTVVSGSCYRYRYSIADRVGNRSTPVATGVAMVDTSAPTAPLLAFSGLNHASVTGSTVFYNATTSGAFTVGATSTDAQSGVASTSFPAFGSGWTGTAGAYTFAAGAADPTEPNNVTATNTAGLTSSPAGFTVTADPDAPTGGSIGYTDGYRTSASVTIALANGNDALSGVDGSSAILQRASATMTDGSCGSFGPYTTIATVPALSYNDTTVTSGNCYAYRYLVADKVGNTATSTTTAIAKIDTNAPTATLSDPGANLRQIVNLASVTGDTGGSGVATVTYQRSDTTGWVTIPQAWDTTTAADGLYDLRVVVTDRAGNSTTSSAVTGRRVDNTAPSATLADPGANLRGTVTLSATTSDSGSGIASVTYQRSDASGWVTIPQAWDTTSVADGTYDLRVVVLDIAGNQTISTVTGRRVDNTAPSATMGSLASPVRGTVTLMSTTSDAGSDIATVTYERQPVGTTGWVTTPATFDTTTVPDGDYDIHVVATDTAGNSTTSAPVRTHVDNTSPRPTAVTPANGTGSVATSTVVTATFPRAMLASSINGTSFTLSSSAGAVPAAVTYDSVTLKATLTPTAALAASTSYTAKLTTAVTAQDGASLYQPYTWTFSTGLMPPPTVTAKTPTDGATGVAAAVAPTATFSRAMDATTITGTTVTMSGPSGAVAAGVTYDSSTRIATITPNAALAGGTTYTVQLSSGIKAQDGIALAATSWSFTTGSSAPSVVSRTPAPGATAVPTATTVTATFSRDMKATTLTTSTMTLTGPSGSVAATVSYDSPSKTATLTPTAPLAQGTTYTASVSGTAQASDGVPMGGASSWTFTTTTGLEVRSTSPAAGAAGVSMAVVPTVQMSQALDAATVTTTNVKLIRPDTSTVPISVAYNSTNFTITITPGAPLDYSGKFTIRLETGITSGGVPLAAQFNSTFTTVGTGITTRVNAGSTTAYTATNGNVFSADSGFIGGTARAVTNTITGTTDPTLYKTERNGTWQYSIPVPNGTYDLKLHFVELTNTACNTRVFSVDVVNTTLVNDISGLDIFCEVGANKPDIKTLTNVPVLGRAMRLKAVVSVGTPQISAIEIIPHPPAASSLTPAAGATGVAVGTTVSAVFSQTMDAASLTTSTVTLSGPSGTVTASVAYDSTTKAVTLTPSAPLAPGVTYTARLDGAIRDSYGLTMGAPYTWTFTTG